MVTAEVTEATPMAEVAAIGNLTLVIILERGFWHSWNDYCFLQRKTSSPLLKEKVAQTLMPVEEWLLLTFTISNDDINLRRQKQHCLLKASLLLLL